MTAARCPLFALTRVARLEMTCVAVPHTTLACGDIPRQAVPGCAACGEAAALMPWARIDDGFDDHPKVLALLDHDDGAAALGLWVLCLTWAHRNTRKKGKVPGRVPLSLPRRYLGVPGRDAAKLLVDAGLWDLAEDGWDIHDFDQYLPTAETSSARSAAGKKGAATRWGKKGETAAADSNEPSADGNLLSGAMANDGNAIAADSNVIAPGAPDTPASRRSDPDSRDDGNLPFPDSNEPSADGKPIASDGSRAPARRAISKEIAPTPVPTPVQPSAVADKPRPGGAAPTPTQRSKRLTDAYAQAEPMCKWPAVNGVVLSAIKSGRFADDEIGEALLRLAADGRSVTVDSLRTELQGFPAQPQRGTAPGESTGTARARAAIEAGRRVQARIDERNRP